MDKDFREIVVNPEMKFDIPYIRTLPGILKVVQMLSNFIGFTCISATKYRTYGIGTWFCIVAILGCFISAILFSFHISRFIKKFNDITWIEIEFACCVILTGSNLISSTFMSSIGFYSDCLAAATFFGFCTMVAYGVDAWLKFGTYSRRNNCLRRTSGEQDRN